MKIKRIHIIVLDIIIVSVLPFISLLSNWMMDNIPRCIFAQHGFLCPACGGTRCMQYLAQGRFTDAFSVNPYLLLTVLFFLLILLTANVTAFSNSVFFKKAFHRLTNVKIIIFWAVGFALFGVLRNFL